MEPGRLAGPAAAVQLPGGRPLLRGPVTRAGIDAALAEVAAMDAAALRAHLARRVPPSVQVTLPGAGPLLVRFDWARVAFGGGASPDRLRALERLRGQAVASVAREGPRPVVG